MVHISRSSSLDDLAFTSTNVAVGIFPCAGNFTLLRDLRPWDSATSLDFHQPKLVAWNDNRYSVASEQEVNKEIAGWYSY